MLVLSRKTGEQLLIGRNVLVTVLKVQGNRVKLGVSGPPEVPIMREELRDRVEALAANHCEEAAR
jgi:carbon storage regulator